MAGLNYYSAAKRNLALNRSEAINPFVIYGPDDEIIIPTNVANSRANDLALQERTALFHVGSRRLRTDMSARSQCDTKGNRRGNLY